jgi:hypothetical protein
MTTGLASLRDDDVGPYINSSACLIHIHDLHDQFGVRLSDHLGERAGVAKGEHDGIWPILK